jgi:hypothetical protein
MKRATVRLSPIEHASTDSTGVVLLLNRPISIRFFDRVLHECLDQSKALIQTALSEAGVESHWSDVLPDDGIPEDLIVLGHSGSHPSYPIGQARFMGKPVARWAAPEDGQFEPLLDAWGADTLLFKSDTSFRRRGVHRIKRGSPLVELGSGAAFNPAGDIFMEVLSDDPRTDKMAVFYDPVIGCRQLETRSAFDPEPWEMGARIGREFAGYSGGYMSIDFMRYRDQSSIKRYGAMPGA